MEQNIIKNLFSEGQFEILADSISWISAWADELVNFYECTNLANNINDIEFSDDIYVNVEDGEIGIIFAGEGNDYNNVIYVYLTATVNNDFNTLSNFNYDTETGDAIEFDEEEEEEEDEE